MIELAITFLVVVLIIGLVFWALKGPLAQLKLPEWAWKIVAVIVVLIALSYLLGGFGGPAFWRRW